jgi:oligoendopeptidase F
MTMTWDDLEPRVAALLDADLDAGSLPAWWIERDEFERDVGEEYARLMRAKDEDTADEEAKEAFLDFVRKVLPNLSAADHELDEKAVAVPGYTPPDDLRVAWLDLQDSMAVFHPANIPLEMEAEELLQRYGEVTGSARVEVDGETLTVTQAYAKLIERDRDLRERVWRALDATHERSRDELDDIFLKLVRLRGRMAANAGFPDYRTMAWRQLHRREYTPENALTLHASIAAEVVPQHRALIEDRRQRLGLDRVRPWDTAVDPYGEEPLRPFKDIGELEDGLQRMFDAIDPELGTWFGRLRGGWMDIEPRPNKVPGLGYQNYFPRSRSPYIYMSAVGTDDDVVTMRHEAGHAFHSIATAERWPLLAHAANRPELNELASEAMELLTLPYLTRERGGFYDRDEATRSRRALLERIIVLWSRTSAVDAIQHWIYTQDPETLTADAIDEEWLRITEDFDSGVDWSGLERSRSKGWHIIHLFHFPFYFLEYGLAYLGAVQIWRNARDDHAGALAAYKRCLALGRTVPLDRAFEAAGARFAFDRDTVRELTEFVMAAMEDDR